MNLSVQLDNGLSTVMVESPNTSYARVKHLHELCGKSILEERGGWPTYPAWPSKDKGVPSVVKLIVNYKEDYCPMEREWQFYSYDLIRMRIRELFSLNPSDVDELGKKVFESFYRDNAWQSNKRGTKTCKDYVNGSNMEKKQVVGLQPIITGDWIVKIVGAQTEKTHIKCVPVQCFDGSKQPPKSSDVNWHTAPHLVNFPTIETRIPTASGREIRKIDLCGVGGIPAFVILRGTETAWLDVTRTAQI